MDKQKACDALVIFGATGDLAVRKLFPALRRLEARGGLDIPVIGVARGAEARLRERISRARADSDDPASLERFLARVRPVSGDYRDPQTYARLCEALGNARRPLIYLAIPPDAFAPVVRELGRLPCAAQARVVLEKPFGRDLASARELSRTLHEAFHEEAIFRIDHYLGKEPVQNLVYFRFANAFTEALWNRQNVDHVEVTLAEQGGVDGRGEFYEQVGTLRDVVQNHLLQIVTHLAMEAPIGHEAQALREEKLKLLRSMRPLAPEDLVRGQYRGYRGERGVAGDSDVETFAAARLWIDSWRWEGVPFLIRAGKRLPVSIGEAQVALRPAPRIPFGNERRAAADWQHGNRFSFHLGPAGSRIGLSARVKEPGAEMSGRQVELQFCANPKEEMDAYERLIGDALAGNAELFASQAGVEAAWRVLDGAIAARTPLHLYEPGSWGPEQAAALAEPWGGWQQPQESC